MLHLFGCNLELFMMPFVCVCFMLKNLNRRQFESVGLQKDNIKVSF